MGLRALGLTVAPLKGVWQGAFGADRTRGSTAASGQVCSVVAWPCSRGGGGTTNGPDVTPTQLSVKTCGGGGFGGIGSSPGGGGSARNPRLPHAYLKGVCVSGDMGYRGMYAMIAISRLCQEESLKGLEDQRHSTPLN